MTLYIALNINLKKVNIYINITIKVRPITYAVKKYRFFVCSIQKLKKTMFFVINLSLY